MSSDPFDPLMSRELTPILTERVPARPSAPLATRDDLRVLSYQFELMQRKIKELEARKDFESRMEMFAARWEEFLNTAEFRFEKIQNQFQKQHDIYKAHFREIQSKLAIAMGWVKERNKADLVLNEMIDQQSQTIQAFEMRMQQWQKIVSEQELQSLNAESDKNRLEKMQAHLQRQTESVQAAFLELRATVKELAIRFGDRQGGDSGVKEMVERQRQLVQSFDARLQQAQKIMSDQEIQLMNARAELKDTLRTLAQLKGR